MSTNRKAKRPYTEKGRCGWCGTTEIPTGRRSWCSQECVDAYRMVADPNFIREKVFERDRGVCAICGCDSNEEYRKARETRKDVARLADRLINEYRFRMVWDEARGRMVFARDEDCRGTAFYAECRKFRDYILEKYAPNANRWTMGRRTGWDADHIVPVIEGGGECDLENIRTLCHPCHKLETAKLAARRAKRNRVEKTGQEELF